MTQQILLSQLSDRNAFESEVRAHIQRLMEFNRTVGKPRPTSHPLVEASIRRIQAKGQPDAYEPDYEIVDDSVPEHRPSLAERKAILAAKIAEAEQHAQDKMFPLRKRRLFQIKFNEAVMVPEAERTPQQLAIIADMEVLNKRNRQLQKVFAQAESDLEDLTEDTIDSWIVPTFE